MDGIIRRREMVNSEGETWDYEWDYTQGKPTAIGWTRSASGTINTDAITTNGLELATGTTGMAFYNNSEASNPIGVCEAKFLLPAYTGNTRQVAQIRFGTSAFCAHIVAVGTSNTNIRLVCWDQSSVSSSSVTLLAQTVSINAEHTIRIELNTNTFDVYLDGVFLKTVTKNAYYPGGTRFGSQNSYTIKSYWRSFKARVGRL